MVGTPRCTTICHGQAGAPLVRVGAADGSAWGMSWWAVGKARRLCDGIYSRAGLGALDWGGSRCVASGGGLPGSATAQLHSSTLPVVYSGNGGASSPGLPEVQAGKGL
ncbi:hypothetical protein ZWY2020_053114 [Hordeum vulgare]|nr:hypothetical protein ZWY2020_053114 [Hordeum vulgare]